jgi:uncharacterized protein (DUF1697 family)
MLLRGINVGGAHVLKMATLKTLLEKLGARQVATYIQSGNVIFSGLVDAAAFEGIVAGEIERSHGFRPRVLVIAEEDFREIVAGYPYPEAFAVPKTGHVWFLSAAADPDRAALADLAAATERFEITARAFYLHAPDGIGRSKLAERAERLLGVAATARNLGTCTKLLALLDASAHR